MGRDDNASCGNRTRKIVCHAPPRWLDLADGETSYTATGTTDCIVTGAIENREACCRRKPEYETTRPPGRAAPASALAKEMRIDVQIARLLMKLDHPLFRQAQEPGGLT